MIYGRHIVGNSYYGMLDFAFTSGLLILPEQVAANDDLEQANGQSCMQQQALREMTTQVYEHALIPSAELATTGRLYRKRRLGGGAGRFHGGKSNTFFAMWWACSFPCT